MPTPTKGPRLGGGPAHERLILANLATSLFEHDQITTQLRCEVDRRGQGQARGHGPAAQGQPARVRPERNCRPLWRGRGRRLGVCRRRAVL